MIYSSRRLILCGLFLGMTIAFAQQLISADRPNVVILYADDLGYGDFQANHPSSSKIPTPNMNRLASEGMRFTDAHSSSGCCSPSRYTLLTGRYHWRTRLQSGIVNLWGKPLIDAKRLTIAKLAQQQGYQTACIGKWHLGMDWQIPEDQKEHFTGFGGKAGGGGESLQAAPTEANRDAWKSLFSKKIEDGPTEKGFHTYFGTEVPNWPPYCFIRNDRTVGIPSEFLAPKGMVKNQASFQGPALPEWELSSVLPTLIGEATRFIDEQAKAKRPFLLYLPLTSPHTPLAVNKEWQGKSGLHSDYADLVMETDAAIGKVLQALKDTGAAENTLVIFTSDNGCANYIGVKDLEAQGHFPSGPLRDYKASAYEGGHRVPFVIRWPGKVPSNTVCKQLVHQADLFATLAEIWSIQLPADAGEDSFSLVPLMKGADQPHRSHAISTACQGQPSFRDGPWKLILGQGKKVQGIEGNVQLFHLGEDLGEKKNLAEEEMPRVHRMLDAFESLIKSGRSTPGAEQKNDVAVKRYAKKQAE